MRKLKKVLLLVLALCVMISIMSIAATATGDNPVAQIGSTTYASLADAIAAVPDNTATTITMLADSVESGTITIASTKNIVLDLNGHTVSHTSTLKSVYFITNNGTLEITDLSVGENGKITMAAVPDTGYSVENVTLYNCGGTLTLTKGTIENTTAGGLTYAVNNSSNAWGSSVISTFNMTGGVLSAPNGDATLRVYQNTGVSWKVYSTNHVNISGGTILDNAIFVDTVLYTDGQDVTDFNNNDITKGCVIDTEINITGGTINGLIDMKIRHPFGTSLNISGGDFTNAKLWVRKYAKEYGKNLSAGTLSEPTTPMVNISGGTWSFVTGKAFGLAYDCGATSWTSYEQPYCVTGGVFNVDLNNYSGIKFESGKTGVANSGANKATYPYTVGVAVASITKNDITTYYASLHDAAAAVQNGDTITMIANTLETNEVKFEFSGSATLDLNGHTVATNEDIWIRTGNLTVVGSEGSKVTSLGENSNGYGFYVSTTSLATNEATLTIDSDNVTVDAEKYGVVLMTNGVFNLVKGHIVSHSNFAVTGNGTAPNVTVNISGGSIESSKTAIYFPATASLNITGGTITGTTAIYQKCGTLTITGGTITATGDAAEYSYNGNGANPTGDAIVIDNCGYPSGAPSANISGADITSEHGKQIGYYVNGTSAEGTVLAASAYTLKTNKDRAWTANTDSTYQYKIGVTYVAKIGDVGYETLQAAIDAAQTDDTVTLYRDVTGSFTIGKSITLTSVNNAKITGSGTSAISINASGVAVTLDGITIAKGATRGVCIDSNAANVTLVINNSSIAAGSYALDTRPGADYATVTVSDTTLDGWAAMNIWGDHGTFNISDSTLNGANTTTQSSSNDFAVIALEADTAARTSGELMGAYAYGNTITLMGCTIGAATSSTNSQAIIVYNAYGEDTNPSQTKAAEYLESGKHAKNNTVIFDGCDYVSTTTGGLVYDGASKLAGGDGTTIYAANNNSFIVKTSGTYTIDPTTYLASGHEAVNNGNGTWTVDKIKVAQIGTTKYASLADAIAAAQSGDTITMIANSAETTGVTLSKDLTIDINGKTVTFEPTPTNNYGGPNATWFNVTVGNTLNIVDTASTKGVLKVDPAYTCTVYFMTNRGTLNLGTDSSNGPAIIIGVSTYKQNVDTTVYATTCPTNRATANGITNYGTVNVKYADFQLSESVTGITTQANRTATYDHASFTITKGATGVQCYNGSNNTFENCTFTISEEGTGIASNGANATITDCTINMSGEESMSASSAYGINVNKSATASTEPDVIITNLTATADYTSYGATVLKVNAGHVVVNSADINAGSYGTSVYFGASALAGFENSPQMEIKGGKYYGEFTASSSKGTIELSGGKYSEDPRVKIYDTFVSTQDCVVIAEGKAVAENTDDDAENYPYTVGVAVASITKNDITTCYASLADAIDAAQDGDTIVLLANIDLTATVNIEKSLTIALNGKSITATNARALWVKSGEVEITGTGTISATKTENGSFSSSSSVIRVGNSGTAKAKLTIGADVTVSTDYCYGVTVFGTNDGGVELVVNGNVTVTGTAAAISGNGNSGNKGNVTINAGAVVTATADAAIYHPQGDALTINGGSITGPVAVYQKSGTMTITGGTIRATGEAAEYSFNGNGANPTGDAIVIDNCDYPGGEPSARISGADITSANGQKIGYYVNGTSAEGTVLADSAYTLNTNTEKEWVADTSVTGYSYRIATPTYVAQIGEVKYETLAAAIDAAQDGDTIKLLADVTYGTDHVVDVWEKEFNLDLNSHTFTTNSNQSITASNNGYKATAICFGDYAVANPHRVISISNGTIRTAYGAGIYADGDVVVTLSDLDVKQNYPTNVQTTDEYSTAIRLTTNANIVVVSGSYEGKYAIVVSNSGGIVTINGGTFKGDIFFSGSTSNNATKSITINGGNFAGTFVNTDKGTLVIKGGYFTVDPKDYVAEGYAVENGTYEIDNVTYTYKVVPYVEQSTTNTTTTSEPVDNGNGATTTTTTTTNLATAGNGQDTQYVIKVETTTVTTPTDNPNNSTEQTNTVYKPVTVEVTSGNDKATNVVVTNTSGATNVDDAKATVEAVTGQSSTFKAKVDENVASPANVLKTTAAANAIAKAAATVGAAGKTGDITDAKVILQTTLKSYTLAGTSNAVVATKVVYDIKPVAVIYKVEGNNATQLGDAVELDNADIKEGETFTFTIPVPANMTGTKVKVSHIGTNGYSSEIGTYNVEGTGNNRYVTVTVDHFSEFELEETTVAIDGNCKITAAIALDDSININFYVQNLASGTSKENYKVVYSFNGETETTVNGASWVETATGSGKYFFKVAECAASQMNDKVSFKVYYNDGYNDVEIKSISYSIRDYCVNMIKKNSNQKLVELCRAVLDYGAAAQNYFNYNKANLANAGGYGLASPVTEIPSEFNALAVDRRSDVSKLTVSLNTVSKTEINFYITASDVTDVTVKLGTTPVEGVVTEQLSDGRYKVTIKGIAAAYLNNAYTLTFKTAKGMSTLRYSALTYSYGKQSSQTAGELSLAIYNYYLKAAAYFS